MPLPGDLPPPSVGFVCKRHDFHLFSSQVLPKLYMECSQSFTWGGGGAERKEKIKPLG